VPVKTTLVKHALGLLKPTVGRVLLEGKDHPQSDCCPAAHTIGLCVSRAHANAVSPVSKEELAFGHQKICVYTPDTIQKNVDWPSIPSTWKPNWKLPRWRCPFGQQKRVSIASILSMRSRNLMIDEPTAGQDYWNNNQFMDAILQSPDLIQSCSLRMMLIWLWFTQSNFCLYSAVKLWLMVPRGV
jgi:energy-coupling factor transport system ATP-binding protein